VGKLLRRASISGERMEEETGMEAIEGGEGGERKEEEGGNRRVPV
jgi:hypothetical protein